MFKTTFGRLEEEFRLDLDCPRDLSFFFVFQIKQNSQLFSHVSARYFSRHPVLFYFGTLIFPGKETWPLQASPKFLLISLKLVSSFFFPSCKNFIFINDINVIT